MKQNEYDYLDEYIDTPDKWFLFGEDKQTIHNFMANLRGTRIISLQIFQKYIHSTSTIAPLSTTVLNILINCLLSRDCKLISGFKNTIEIQKIFTDEYEKFHEEFSANKPLAIDLLHNTVSESNIKTLHQAIINGKKDLYTNIIDSMKFIENHHIKGILSNDTHIETIPRNRYENSLAELDEDRKQKGITATKYKRLKHEKDLLFRETVIQEKMKLLRNSFKMVKTDLTAYLKANFEAYADDVLGIFEKDYSEIVEKLGLGKYSAKKNKTNENIFNYLSQHQSNYTLQENNLTYYIFIYDILLIKYKYIAVYLALNIHKMNTKDLEILISKGLLNEIQDRKRYYSFFKNITAISHISSYLYKQLSMDKKSNALRFILNYKNESPPTLEHVHIFPIFPVMLEKSRQTIAFNFFKILPQ